MKGDAVKEPPPSAGQQAGGTHSTGMHSYRKFSYNEHCLTASSFILHHFTRRKRGLCAVQNKLCYSKRKRKKINMILTLTPSWRVLQVGADARIRYSVPGFVRRPSPRQERVRLRRRRL